MIAFGSARSHNYVTVGRALYVALSLMMGAFIASDSAGCVGHGIALRTTLNEN